MTRLPVTKAQLPLVRSVGCLAFQYIQEFTGFFTPCIVAIFLRMVLGMLISRIKGERDHPKSIDYSKVDTSTSTDFDLAALVVVLMLGGLYISWW